MSGQYFRVVITDTAKEMLREIGKRFGKKTYEVLRDLIADLEFEPERKGDALRHPLHGLHSRHSSRFRVIYRIERGEARVLVVAAGHHASGQRNDIYQIVRRLVQNGALDMPKDPPSPPAP